MGELGGIYIFDLPHLLVCVAALLVVGGLIGAALRTPKVLVRERPVYWDGQRWADVHVLPR